MKYFMYCRKSTEDEYRQVQSIEDQKRAMLIVAESRGIARSDIIDIFEESRSAKSPGRPVFSQMMERIHKGEVQGILSYSMDRLARNPICGGAVIWILQQGVIQKIITHGREYSPNDSVLMINVEFGMATEYVRELSRNTRRGMISKSEKGWKTGVAPFGYLNDRIEKTIVKDPDRFNMIRKIWDMVLSGVHTPKMAADIASNEWGLTSVKRKRSGGNLICRSTVYNILKNPFYYGEFEYDGEIYEGKHEPMITRSEFDHVQKILGRNYNPRPSKRSFAFTGLLKCGECGCSITAEEKTKYIQGGQGIRKYTYYHCTKKKLNPEGSRCTQKSIETKALEESISGFLSRLTIPSSYLACVQEYLLDHTDTEIQTREIAKKNIDKQLQDCVSRFDNLLKLKISPDNSDNTLLSDEEFKDQKKAITQKKNAFQEQLKNLDTRQNDWVDLTAKTFEFCRVAQERFENGTDKDKKIILNCVGSKLILKDKKLSIEAKKVFQVIEKSLEEETDDTPRLEPPNSGSDKRQSGGLSAGNPAWLPTVVEVLTIFQRGERIIFPQFA